MAKKFSFRLEPILNIRSFKVKEKKDELAYIYNLRFKKEIEIENKEIYFNNLHISKTGKVKANELQADYHHKRYVKDEIVKLGQDKERLIEIENLKRINLREAMKEEKILQKLKEKQMLTHNQALLKEENLMLDEVALNQHTKNYRELNI